MMTIIAFLIYLGVITSESQATQALIDQYTPQYEEHIITTEMDDY